MNEQTTREAEPRAETTLEQTDAKCPCCAGTISYDPAKGRLVCPYCGHEQEIETDDKALEQDFLTAQNAEENFSWGENSKTVICENCGGESVYDELATSNICPFCGSNHVMPAATKKSIAPHGIVPFNVTKEQANTNFTKWLKGQIFAPSAVKKQAKAAGMTGLFFPVWTFDADTTSKYTAQAGYTTTTGSGKDRHTTTTYRNVSGVYCSKIDDAVVFATDRQDPALLDKILPYNTNGAKPYDPQFLAGFVSERYSVGLKDGWVRGQAVIRGLLTEEVECEVLEKHHADEVRAVNLTTLYQNIKHKYLMLPIWTANFSYKEKIYRFMVNGETGKVGGKFPLSPIRVAIAVLLVAALAWFIFQFCEE